MPLIRVFCPLICGFGRCFCFGLLLFFGWLRSCGVVISIILLYCFSLLMKVAIQKKKKKETFERFYYVPHNYGMV